MATDMQKLIGTSEEDEEEDMDMDVKEEDDGDGEENGEKHVATPVMVEVGGMATSGSNNQFQYHDQQASRRCRPLEEKERTKLRERHRRAITARILAGLRRHGNYNLRVRADINDVIAALAREAGWVVLPDGTTFPSRSQVLILFLASKIIQTFVSVNETDSASCVLFLFISAWQMHCIQAHLLSYFLLAYACGF